MTYKQELLNLLEQHRAYITRCKDRGDKTAQYRTPCCDNEMEDRVPPKGARQWDSLTACPHCGGMYMKIARHDGITTFVPEGHNNG